MNIGVGLTIIVTLLAAAVGAFTSACMDARRKRSEEERRRAVIAAQIAREIGLTVLTLIRIRRTEPMQVTLMPGDIALPWCTRISEWASLFPPDTVAYISDFSRFATDVARLHAQCRQAANVGGGRDYWRPYLQNVKGAINTGIPAFKALEHLGLAAISNPDLNEDVIESFRLEQITRLKIEQARPTSK